MIKVGIVGAGFIGNIHAGAYRFLPDVKVSAICDIREEKAQELAKKTGAVKFSDYGDMLKEAQVDVVDVCLPTYLHSAYTVKAAQAGHNVLCEKPIALNLREADQMVKACRKNKVKFMVAHCIRFWPQYQYLYDLMRSRRFGGLKTLALSRLSPTPVWSWRNWVLDADKSGLTAIDLHIHDTDYILYLLGMPQAVSSVGRKGGGGWAHVYSVFRYKDGVSAYAEGGWDYPENFPFEMAYRAGFEKAAVVFSSNAQPTVAVYQGKEGIRHPEISQPKVGEFDAGGNISGLAGYYNEIRYFIDCLKEDKEPEVVTPEDARASLKVVLKEIESLEQGKEVSLR